MDYDAHDEEQKRINRTYTEFMYDIINFQERSNLYFNTKLETEESKSKCNNLHNLLNRMYDSIPQIKQIITLRNEAIEKAHNI